MKHVAKRAAKPKTATPERIGQIALHGGRHPNQQALTTSPFNNKQQKNPTTATNESAVKSHGTTSYPAKNLRKPHLQFGDDADFRYYTTSEPSQNFDKEMLMEYSGKPSTNWQRQWLFRQLIKFNKKYPTQTPLPRLVHPKPPHPLQHYPQTPTS